MRWRFRRAQVREFIGHQERSRSAQVRAFIGRRGVGEGIHRVPREVWEGQGVGMHLASKATMKGSFGPVNFA